MSGNTTAIERLLEVSNKLWDAMYESGEVPTYGERAHYYLALKDAMAENAKLRKLVLDVHAIGWSGFDCTECPVSFSGRCENNGGCNWLGILTDRMRELGIEVDA